MLIDELDELAEALESNIMDGDSATVESNAIQLLDIAQRQGKLIQRFKDLINVDAGTAIDTIIELQSE